MAKHEISDQEILALKAVLHGCNTNRRLQGAIYLHNFKNPEKMQQIKYSEAINIAMQLIDRLEGDDNGNM